MLLNSSGFLQSLGMYDICSCWHTIHRPCRHAWCLLVIWVLDIQLQWDSPAQIWWQVVYCHAQASCVSTAAMAPVCLHMGCAVMWGVGTMLHAPVQGVRVHQSAAGCSQRAIFPMPQTPCHPSGHSWGNKHRRHESYSSICQAAPQAACSHLPKATTFLFLLFCTWVA